MHVLKNTVTFACIVVAAALAPTLLHASANQVYDIVNGDGTTDRVHVFRDTGAHGFTPPGAVTEVQYLVVGGGGSGGSGVDDGVKGTGGGGAGGFRTGRMNVTPGQEYSVTVGAGGVATTTTNDNVGRGANGKISIFASTEAAGGGGGGNFSSTGAAGGSGGGAGGRGSQSGGSGNTPQVSPSQGLGGGRSSNGVSGEAGGGGGGGAGAAGANGGTTSGGAGGQGLSSWITGTLTWYGGGGGGAGSGASAGGGGIGGGGGGAGAIGTPGVSGTPNTGGGGGGIRRNAWGGNGGSGIVVVRYTVPGDVSSNGAVVNITAVPPVTSPGLVPVQVTLSGFGDATHVVAIVSLSDNGGTLSLIETTGLALEYGYGGFSDQQTLGFRGTLADVGDALANHLRWNAPMRAVQPELHVTVVEYAAGTFYNPANGHYYRPVEAGGTLSWKDAKTAAAEHTLFGMTGYLATITSRQENEFVASYTDLPNIWIAASDDYLEINEACGQTVHANQSAAEGRWYWVTGPEACTQFWLGAAAGSPVTGRFALWYTNEPNNHNGLEHYAATNYLLSGSMVRGWNDFQNGSTSANNYLVEFGGMGEASSAKRAGATLALTATDQILVGRDEGGTVIAEPVSAPVGTIGAVVGVGLPAPFADTENNMIAVVRVPSGGGTLTISNTAGLTLAYGYSSFVNQGSIGFHGTRAAVATALRDFLRWNAPPTGQQVELSVSVAEYAANHFYNPVNGHYYRYVASSGIQWYIARDAAADLALFGMTGYLATITSEQENDFVANHVDAANIWLGATDQYIRINEGCGESRYSEQTSGSTPSEGRWYWAAGPDTCTQFWQGAVAGSPVEGRFSAWSSSEPNNSSSIEHYAVTNWNGTLGSWNDLAYNHAGVSGYLVEFGGLSNEASTALQAGGTGTLIAMTVPDAPYGVIAAAGNSQATVSWTPPAYDGDSPITGYAVTASPDAATCAAVAPATSCTVTGLVNQTEYTFTVTATNALGTSASSAASAPVTPLSVYTLSYNAGAGGTISGENPQTIVHGEDGSQVTAVPNSGHFFVNWSDSVGVASRTDTNVMADLTVTANFAIHTYPVTTTATQGTITSETNPIVSHGDTTTVTGAANAGHYFTAVSGCSGVGQSNADYGVTTFSYTTGAITGACTVTATFAAIPEHTVTYQAGPYGAIDGVAVQSVEHGASTSSVTAAPSTWHRFVRWSDGSLDNPRSDSNVTESFTVQAHFEAIIESAGTCGAGPQVLWLAEGSGNGLVGTYDPASALFTSHGEYSAAGTPAEWGVVRDIGVHPDGTIYLAAGSVDQHLLRIGREPGGPSSAAYVGRLTGVVDDYGNPESTNTLSFDRFGNGYVSSGGVLYRFDPAAVDEDGDIEVEIAAAGFHPDVGHIRGGPVFFDGSAYLVFETVGAGTTYKLLRLNLTERPEGYEWNGTSDDLGHIGGSPPTVEIEALATTGGRLYVSAWKPEAAGIIQAIDSLPPDANPERIIGTTDVAENVLGNERMLFGLGGEGEAMADACYSHSFAPLALGPFPLDTPVEHSLPQPAGWSSPTYAVAGGSLPAGFELSESGLFTGTSAQEVAYTFTVTIIETGGEGRSETRQITLVFGSVPDAPAAVTATAGDGQATVSWTAPASDGGIAVTSYTVTSSPDGLTCTAEAPATFCTVAGLTNGTQYTFTATATNAAGTSVSSDPSTGVTPIAYHTVTFELAGGTHSGGGALVQSVAHGSAATAPELTPPAGYVFAQWSAAFDTITAEVTITAQYVEASFAVSASAGTGGAVDPASRQVTHGQTASFTVIPATGYRIAGVTGCGGTLVGNVYTTGAISESCSVAASFGPDFADGGGTAEDPYVVSTPEQFARIGDDPSAHYAISGDIDLSDQQPWTPIGSAEAPFTGSLTSGDGHPVAIGGLDGQPLFGVIGPGAEISDLVIAGSVNDDAGSTAGLLANEIKGTEENPARIDNVTIDAGSRIDGDDQVGGLAGIIEHAELSNITIEGNVSGNDNVGGIGGTIAWSIIADSTVSGNVTGTGENVGEFGGSLGEGVVVRYTVFASAGTGGSVDTASRQVNAGQTASFTITPHTGYSRNTAVGGDCPAGSWSGTTWTSGPVTGACSVHFQFGLVSLAPPPIGTPGEGVSVQVHTPGDGSQTAWVFDPTDPPRWQDLEQAHVDDEPIPPPPDGYEYPHDLLAFTLILGEAGSAVQVSFTYPEPLPANAVYWKYGRASAADAAPSWYQLPDERFTIDGNQLTLTLHDGMLGDDDWQANGIIHDPGLPGVPAGHGGPTPPVPSPPSPEVTPIPTLSEWAMMALAALILLITARRQPRVQRSRSGIER